MADRVLIIDDDQRLLSSFRRQLASQFEIETAQGGPAGIDSVEEAQKKGEPFAVVVTDMRMPGLDGIETLRRIRAIEPDTVRMMLTGNADQQTAIDAINRGQIFRFYSKPALAENIAEGLRAGIEQYRLITAEKDLLERTLAGSIAMLCDLITINDAHAGQNSVRLKRYIRRLTEEFDMPLRWQLEVAVTLLPLGNALVPAEILAKKRSGAPLDDAERDILEKAPETARRLIANIPRLELVAEIVHLQDKNFDGSGLPPTGPVGNAQPLDVRLLRILRDLAALIDASEITHAAAFAEMGERAGVYDPQLLGKVRSCLENEPVTQTSARMRITLIDLKPGDLLVSDIKLDNGHLILASGIQVSASQIERLRNLVRIFAFIEPIEIRRPIEADGKAAG